jgi:hypothetical protein
MIEQNLFRLWERAASRKAPWDAAAARAALRELGLDPRVPPPEFAVEASADNGAPEPDSLPESGVSPGEPETDPSTTSWSPSPSSLGEDCAGGESGLPDQVRDDETQDTHRDGAAPDFPAPLGEVEDGAERQRVEGWGLSGAEGAGDGHHPNPSSKEEGPLCREPATSSRKTRHHEWTRARMVGFLRELAACQNVSQAARSVGMGRQSAYKLRDRMGGTPFALAWEVALESGVQQLAHALLDRALNGEEVPHYYQGEEVGRHRKFDNRLAMWLVQNHSKLGRQPAARSLAASTGEWEALLERIETDSFDWYEGETLNCAPGHLQAAHDDGEAAAEEEDDEQEFVIEIDDDDDDDEEED